MMCLMCLMDMTLLNLIDTALDVKNMNYVSNSIELSQLLTGLDQFLIKI